MELFIGTSGWSYKHWENGVFYPAKIGSEHKLTYYTKQFNTVEINSTFYRQPLDQTYQKWFNAVPDDFIFSVKANKFITHTKRLSDCSDAVEKFLKGASLLGHKLGPILFQLPPSLRKDIDRLKEFLDCLDPNHFYSFEFRHETWFCEEVYKIFRSKNLAICQADSKRYPISYEVTADFAYIRFHGGEVLYATDYQMDELAVWADRIIKLLRSGLKGYCYFNNDYRAFAIKNALELRDLISNAMA
ncbi:MAG: DUF72 domain-containing protein [Actinobacteria bacterium]|nr:DUF72 domain-containing protein [Actinomycetota bacterium]